MNSPYLEGELKYIVSRVTNDPTLKGVELVHAEDLMQRGFDRVTKVDKNRTRFATSSAHFTFPSEYTFAYTPNAVVALWGATNELTALPFNHNELRSPKKPTS